MINVLAFINVKPGLREDFIKIFKANVPAVLAEEGCVAYAPTVDVDSGLPPQEKDENLVTIIEKWESLDHLKAHLQAPHMKAYKEKTKDMVEKTTIRVLQEA